jgi:hypothetical protein
MAPYGSLVGVVDFQRDDGSIVEVKTIARHLTVSHKAQLWIYAHMHRALGGAAGLCHRLINAASGQMLKLRIYASVQQARDLLAAVLREHGRIENEVEWQHDAPEP